MAFWWLAWKDLLMLVRDKKALLTLVAMPLLLISILGAAFGNMFAEEDAAPIKKFTLGVVNLDDGPLSTALIEEVFQKQLSKGIKIKQFNEEDLHKKIENRSLAVGLIIESDFSSTLLAGNETKVKLLTGPDPGIKDDIVEKVIEQFADSIPIEVMARQAAQPVQADSAGADTPSTQPAQAAPTTTDHPQEQSASQHLIKETTVNAKTKIVSSFQYYAAAMGVMFLLMTVVQGVSNMILEKEQEVYKRLLLSQLTYTNYLIGKMIGLVIICLLQAAIIIVGTKYIFGVDWGASAFGIAIMTAAFVINACGLGVLAGAFVKTEKAFSVAGMFGSQILAALGGSMAPLYIFPDWVVAMTKLLPNGLALQTYLKLMTGASLVNILPAVGGAVGLGVLFFAIGLIRLSIERRGKYA
ncbi:ABC transporter permease [Neobacillus niacini]|uniref:ABC transporter permease n=1 Tax=Neobacillus niacini TaxID=86668 RepID=UPI0021CB67DE|nr:ABC transporter permease [Neobacillus niacini]MCM3768111.1 ABC transporter permease [Neobacillus niacini]